MRLFTTGITLLAPLVLAACSASLPSNFSFPIDFSSPNSTQTSSAAKTASSASANVSEKQCLVRALYFESNRASESGMLAVATVVMNRVASPEFANSICAVVGAPNQFAKGILVKPMNEAEPLALANSVARRVLAGQRHPGVRSAKFFHQAGLSFPYDNMTYVLKAGGNAFYIKG